MLILNVNRHRFSNVSFKWNPANFWSILEEVQAGHTHNYVFVFYWKVPLKGILCLSNSSSAYQGPQMIAGR